MLGGAGGGAECELEVTERPGSPALVLSCAELPAQLERLLGARAAVLLASAAGLQPRQPGEAVGQVGALVCLAGEGDRLPVGGFGDRRAVGGRLVAGGEVQRRR